MIVLFAVLIAVAYGTANAFDEYFVGDVYEDRNDGGIISALFQSLSGIIVFVMGLAFIGISEQDMPILELIAQKGVISGMCYSFAVALMFYAYDRVNSAAYIEGCFSLEIPIIALIEYFIFDQVITERQMIGLALAFAGAILLSYLAYTRQEEKLSQEMKRVFWIMLVAAFMISWSFILEEDLYRAGIPFWMNFGFFSIGAGIVGGVLWTERAYRLRGSGKVAIVMIVKQRFWWIAVAEMTTVIGAAFFHLALMAGGSSYFVAAIQAGSQAGMSIILTWYLLPQIGKRYSWLKEKFTGKRVNVGSTAIFIVISALLFRGYYLLST